MKITEFPPVQVLDPTNMFLLDGPAGTKIIYAPNLAKELLKMGGTEAINSGLRMADLTSLEDADPMPENPMIMIGGANGNYSSKLGDGFWAMVEDAAKDDISVKRGNYRGQNLGSVVTAEQYAAIADGTFEGLFLGDYWEIGGRKWRIMDFDYWWNSGDVACKTHHLVIMPDQNLTTSKMNETDTTAGGYMGASLMSNALVNQAMPIFIGAFGEDHALNYRNYLTNVTTDGHPSAGIWVDVTIALPNEIMIYGCPIFTAVNNGSSVPALYTIDKTQLAAMRVNPVLINPHRQWYWLRDVVSAAYFAAVSSNGDANYAGARSAGGVRPVFGLIG